MFLAPCEDSTASKRRGKLSLKQSNTQNTTASGKAKNLVQPTISFEKKTDSKAKEYPPDLIPCVTTLHNLGKYGTFT